MNPFSCDSADKPGDCTASVNVPKDMFPTIQASGTVHAVAGTDQADPPSPDGEYAAHVNLKNWCAGFCGKTAK
jgi:hypothetical protein